MDTQPVRSKAGSKEQIVFSLLKQKVRGLSLLGKRRFHADNVEISTDESFKSDSKTYLVEVDSGNMAKLLVGQYVLINALPRPNDEQFFFLVIHTYTSYTPQRTVANLSLVNQKLYSGEGIPFAVVHMSSVQKWLGGSVSDLLRVCVPAQPTVQPDGPASGGAAG